MFYVIKTQIEDPIATEFDLPARKTMYGGKKIAPGDLVYLIDSETTGGSGLAAKCHVLTARVVPRRAGIARQTPLVDVTIRRMASARRTFGRADVKPFADWQDGRPETELNFKLYRQATDKIVGISAETAAFLDGCF